MQLNVGLQRRPHTSHAARHRSAQIGAHDLQRGCRPRIAALNCTAVMDWHLQSLKHVVDSNDFNKASMEAIFNEALKMESVRPGSQESEMLKGYLVSTLFYEPSTRTRLSFEAAMGRLGGTIVSTESAAEYSSAAKGETLEGG